MQATVNLLRSKSISFSLQSAILAVVSHCHVLSMLVIACKIMLDQDAVENNSSSVFVHVNLNRKGANLAYQCHTPRKAPAGTQCWVKAVRLNDQIFTSGVYCYMYIKGVCNCSEY